jgi:hypothetical protein
MKGHASTWIEGDGTVRTVFRTLALWAYSSEDKAKLQLVKVIERKNEKAGPFILQYAIDRRKKEIQWISLYMPLLALLFIGVLLVAAGLFSQNPRNLFISLGTVIFLGFFFRVTWFTIYLDACRFLHDAGDALWKERLGDSVAEKADPIRQPALKTPEISGLTDEAIVDSAPPGKGAISIYLLDELIKKESGRPNIYKGDIHKTTEYYSFVSGCQQKNIVSKTKYYVTRDSIGLNTANARSTHRKYLEILLQHYDEIGDDVLYKPAGDLQAFIEKLPPQKNV